MPKTKASRKQSSSSSSDSDSGPEDRGPAKKQKVEGEENSWDLGKNRFVKLTEFKGKWYVNIREFYNDDGVMKPTKKGLMLTMEQWQKFKGIVGDIDESIKRNV